MTQILCHCESNFPLEECHGTGSGRFVPAPKAQEMLFEPPNTVPKDTWSALIDGFTSHSNYDVVLHPPESWLLKLRNPIFLLEHQLLMRVHQSGSPHWQPLRRDLLEPWIPVAPGESARAARAFAKFQSLRSCQSETELDILQNGIAAMCFADSLKTFEGRLHEMGRQLLRLFPQARIEIVYRPVSSIGTQVLIRALGRCALLPLDEIKQMLKEQRASKGTSDFPFSPKSVLSTLAQHQYPDVTFDILDGLTFTLLVDYGVSIPIRERSRREDQLRSVTNDLFTTGGPDDVHRQLTLAEDARAYARAWTTVRLNRLLSQLAFPGTFRNRRTNRILPEVQWTTMLTLRDIFDLSALISSTSNRVSRRLTFFDLADRYSGLSGKSIEELFGPASLRKLDDGFRESGPLGVAMAEFLSTAWRKVVDEIWQGIHSERVRDQGQIQLRDAKDGTFSASPEEFAVLFLGGMRNRTHGFVDGSQREFARILVHHDGGLPNGLRDLAFALMFGLLCAPSLFFRRSIVQFELQET